MLHPLDDHPIHQTPEPLLHPAAGDRNFYDRFFFHGYSRAGDLFFGVALGVYPNRRVADASVSVVRNARQVAVHASREANDRDTRVGPIALEIIEPMRTLRVRVDPNRFGIEADLVFQARTAAVEEPRFLRRVDGRLWMDVTRFTQFGAWTGELRVEGEPIPIDLARVLGCRDRSWGFRPVGGPEGGPPGPVPQFFWLWAPVHFDGFCTHLGVNEDSQGRRWHENGVLVPLLGEGDPPARPPKLEPMVRVEHRIRWASQARQVAEAELVFVPASGEPSTLSLEPLLTFSMRGLGYLHPEWGHGMWKGSEVADGESWELGAIDRRDPRHLHLQQLCRARMGSRQGIGVLEHLAIGPHAPSGLG